MSTVVSCDYDNSNDGYDVFLKTIQGSFNTVTGENKAALFTTDAVGLFDVFLDKLPKESRQHYTCNTCREFVERYGGLVCIGEDGKTVPVMWSKDVPVFFRDSVNAVNKLVSKSKVTGVFVNSNRIIGTPVTGKWHHMSVDLGTYRNVLILNDSQVMAQKKEDYKTLLAGLYEFSISDVEQAVRLLKTDSLYRSEKCLGIALFLLDLHNKLNSTKNKTIKDNFVWMYVANAPAGFCHIKSSMIGTLLEDIASGMSFESISRRFAEKMNPMLYQRPQALPSAGNIAQAEMIVSQLKASGSFARRFARFDEIKTIWRYAEQKTEDKTGGMFSHLTTKTDVTEKRQIELPSKTVTWVKFAQTVLPTAKSIEVYIPNSANGFTALVTAVDMSAPPIIQWDFEDERNPVSSYVYNRGSYPNQWNIEPNKYHRVNGICYRPSQWSNKRKFDNQEEGVILIIDGAKDTEYKGHGIALFPEIMKSEFHSIRSTIEAYSRGESLQGYDESSANGLLLQKRDTYDVVLLVDGMQYKIDRWD